MEGEPGFFWTTYDQRRAQGGDENEQESASGHGQAARREAADEGKPEENLQPRDDLGEGQVHRLRQEPVGLDDDRELLRRGGGLVQSRAQEDQP